MLRKPTPRHAPTLAGLTVVALLVAATLVLPDTRETLRENAFDLVLAADRHLRPKRDDPGNRVIVVDIDRRSIELLKVAWPWPRDMLARLVAAVVAAKPAAIAIDILFSEPDSRSPAALARRLGHLTDRQDILALAEDLPDGDRRLADELARAPAALGFLLDPDRSQSVAGAPILTRGPLPVSPLWRFPGALGPTPLLAAAAHGLGTISLGDAAGTVRHVPLLASAADRIVPGLALEAVRLAGQASAFLIQSDPPVLAVGNVSIPLPPDAMLRLRPVTDRSHSDRTISAIGLLNGTSDPAPMGGAIVLIGGSAEELGGNLWPTVIDPLTPSVQIQADAITQILAGEVPRPFDSRGLDLSASLALAIVALLAGTALAPALGFIVTLVGVSLLWIAAVALSAFADRLFDPLTPSLFAALAFVVTSGVSYGQTRRREALVRRRFEQHLAPAVVSRIVQNPSLVKLGGERREVTALFTDIEGFTTMTQHADPERLVSVLDSYFEGLATIVIEHGGMVDKIVGDAIHALFNVPVDLEDHARQAVSCAIAIRHWSREYRQRSEPVALGLGRTRVGVETGSAVVGDVGIAAKLDYTAHGDAVNVTARLEAANKDLGSTICIGPTAAGRCHPGSLRPLGEITVRGRAGALAVFEPWPDDASTEWRERYLAAFRLIDGERERAIDLFTALASLCPDDPVPQRIVQRLREPMMPPAKTAT